MPPLRVLFAIPGLDHGGPDRVVFELLTNLDRSRFTPSLLVSDPGGYYFSRLPADLPIEVLAGARGFRHRYPVLRALQFVRKTAPDLVFATLRMTLTLGLTARAFPRHTKLVLRQANDLSADFAVLMKSSLIKHRLARRVALATLGAADAVVCQSEAMRTNLHSLLGDRSKLHVISNPVDVAAVNRQASASQSELPGSPALVSVGRLMPQKGFDVLLEAIAKIRDRVPGLHLTIFGEGPDRPKLEALIRSLRLGDSVTLAGFTAEPLPHVRAASLFVLASRYEGFPNAALEALACGTPVMLTDCPGANSEIVVDGVNGRLARAVTPDAVADALLRAIAEIPTYNRTQISAECDRRFASRKIVHQYETLLGQTRG